MLLSMKTMNKSFLSSCCVFFAALLLATSAWADTKYYGFKFPDSIELDGKSLQLNGVGGRSVPVIRLRVFASALYLPEKCSDPQAITKMVGPKRLQIRMSYGVAAKEFKKALIRGIEKNYTAAEQAQLQPRTQAFAAIIDSFIRVEGGDTINMDYLPETGLVISVDGKVKGAPIVGADFYAAVLRIFIGERPTDQELKARLLGLSA